MTSTIMIGDQEVALTANAATCYRYKMVFGKDLFQIFKSEEDVKIDAIQELAYVMNKQATGDIKNMSFDNYMTWLEDFGALDFAQASAQIVSVYSSQQKGTSKAKKKVNPQSES